MNHEPKGCHCEERSDAAIHAPGSHGSPRPDGLAMTKGGHGLAMTKGGRGLAMTKGCHCEERSDVAIHAVRSHGSPRPDGLAMTRWGRGLAMTRWGRGLAMTKGGRGLHTKAVHSGSRHSHPQGVARRRQRCRSSQVVCAKSKGSTEWIQVYTSSGARRGRAWQALWVVAAARSSTAMARRAATTAPMRGNSAGVLAACATPAWRSSAGV